MIYLECAPDEVLTKTLGISKKQIHHAGSKGNVCNRLRRSRNSKGLVDEDPGSAQPGYLQTLRLYLQEQNIKVFRDENAQNYLIMLCPRLEGWILSVALKVEVDVKRYRLPEDENEFHKSVNVKREDFEELLNELKEKSEAIKILGKLLKDD